MLAAMFVVLVLPIFIERVSGAEWRGRGLEEASVAVEQWSGQMSGRRSAVGGRRVTSRVLAPRCCVSSRAHVRTRASLAESRRAAALSLPRPRHVHIPFFCFLYSHIYWRQLLMYHYPSDTIGTYLHRYT